MREPAILASHSVELRVPLDSDVLEGGWHSWYNDQSTTLYNSHGVYPVDRAQELALVRGLTNNNDTILFAVVQKDDKRLVGNAALQHIDLINRHCEIAITIGEDAPISTGVEVFGMLVEHAFTRLNLNRVRGSTHEELITFVRLLSILGFQSEGRGRQHYFRNGKWSDIIYFALLASDYFRLRNERSGKILFSTYSELLSAIKSSVSKGQPGKPSFQKMHPL